MLLAPRNDVADDVNRQLLKKRKILGTTREQKSVDMLRNADEVVNYPTEFLNSLETSEFPQQIFKLKIDATIMCL